MPKKRPEQAALLAEARQYRVGNDVYQAVKVYRLLLKHYPDCTAGLVELGMLYLERKEWKPALHFLKKALALLPADRQLWWQVGTAATALGKSRLARSIWSKFGYRDSREERGQLVSLRLVYEGRFELLWGRRTGPASARIINIPSPESGLGYLDEVLIAGKPSGYQVAARRRYPSFDMLDLMKRAHYATWSCVLRLNKARDLELMEELCQESGLGFENWSNASRMMSGKGTVPEYHHSPMEVPSSGTSCHIAIAGRRERVVRQVLHSWQVISLGHSEDLVRHS